MGWLKQISYVLMTLSTISVADVAGEKIEVLGKKWEKTEYTDWLASGSALVTPELTNFVIQACLRKTQERIDPAAYDVTKVLVGEMDKTYAKAEGKYEQALRSLTTLLKKIDGVKAESPEDFIDKCKGIVGQVLGTDDGDGLRVAFEGRLQPDRKATSELPADLQAVLVKLKKKGLEPSPLVEDKIPDHFCFLEGYYSESYDEKLWKFFAMTRAMGSVLPSTDGEAAFLKAANKSRKVTALIGKLNRYSSVAGVYNGATIGMTETERKNAGVRATGVALGSKATSLMAYFTTPWREQIQKAVMDQDQYPPEPFNLLSAAQILKATDAQLNKPVTPTSPDPTQTEWGMSAVAASLKGDASDYGKETQAYREATGLAWLALNAETNIRVNEKITPTREFAVAEPEFKPAFLYGKRADYKTLEQSLVAALRAYKEVDKDGELTPFCVTNAKEFTAAAQKALGDKASVKELQQTEIANLQSPDVEIRPVIAHIGGEVNDTIGQSPAGLIHLHIATGFGRAVPATVESKKYTLFTPTGIVLHADKQINTAQWWSKESRKGEVQDYEK